MVLANWGNLEGVKAPLNTVTSLSIPLRVFCVAMSVDAVLPLEGSAERQTAVINKHGDRRECYLILIFVFVTIPWTGNII